MTEASTAARPDTASQEASLELIGLTRRFGSVVLKLVADSTVPVGEQLARIELFHVLREDEHGQPGYLPAGDLCEVLV